MPESPSPDFEIHRAEEHSNLCGPASLQNALETIHIKMSLGQLGILTNFYKEKGVEQSEMAAAIEAIKKPFMVLTNSSLDMLSSLIKSGGAAIVDYMDRDVGTDHPLGDNFNPENDCHYAVYFSHNDKNVKLICNYRGVYEEPVEDFNKYWWDTQTDGSLSVGWSLIIFPDEKSKSQGLENLNNYLSNHPEESKKLKVEKK